MHVHDSLNFTLCSRNRCGAREAMTVGCKSTTSDLPGVAAHSDSMIIAPRASRAGLPLCGSGPDSVWQRQTMDKVMQA